MSPYVPWSVEQGIGSVRVKLAAYSVPDSEIRRYRFADAMHGIFDIHMSILRGGSVPAGQLAALRAQLASVVSDNDSGWYMYTYETPNIVRRARDEGWFDPCLRRSAIEFVSTFCDEIIDDSDRETIADIDRLLREEAKYVDPLDSDEIPLPIPSGHWWWTLPAEIERPSSDHEQV